MRERILAEKATDKFKELESILSELSNALRDKGLTYIAFDICGILDMFIEPLGERLEAVGESLKQIETFIKTQEKESDTDV